MQGKAKEEQNNVETFFGRKAESNAEAAPLDLHRTKLLQLG